MALRDLHILPRTRDSLSYLYVEHCRIDQEEKAIALHDADGMVPVPCAALSLLLLGPGTNISHAAIRTLAEHGCLVQWTGEEGVRFYAQGMGETRSSRALLRQARLVSDPELRLQVVRRMYEMRFSEPIDPAMSLQQLRGLEGSRVRAAYQRASRETGVPWAGRSYQRAAWAAADPVNRALSAANSCLYGISHAAIVAAGYSPGLGFIHTGKGLSFVYDVADLYKAEITVPIAFRHANSGTGLETRVRLACRDAFREQRLMQRLVPDLDRMMAITGAADEDPQSEEENPFDGDEAAPGNLWDPEGEVEGGMNRSGNEPDDD